MKEDCIDFYINKFSCLNSSDELDVSFVPSILRRRLSRFDKCAISVLYKVFSDDVQNIVFSSQYGEVERLLKIIKQYTEENSVSPNAFSCSVHNFPIGFFLSQAKKTIPYTALSSCNNSVSSGLIAAVIGDYDNVVFCYTDISDDNVNSFALNIGKNGLNQSEKYRIKFDENKGNDDFSGYMKLFNKEINYLNTSLCRIERV